MLTLTLAIVALSFLNLALFSLVAMVAPTAIIVAQALVALVSGMVDAWRYEDRVCDVHMIEMDLDAQWRAFVREEIADLRWEEEVDAVVAVFDDYAGAVVAEVDRLAKRARAEQDILEARKVDFWIVPCESVDAAMAAYLADTTKTGAKFLYERLALECEAGLAAWRAHRHDVEVAKLHYAQLLHFATPGRRSSSTAHEAVTAVAV